MTWYAGTRIDHDESDPWAAVPYKATVHLQRVVGDGVALVQESLDIEAARKLHEQLGYAIRGAEEVQARIGTGKNPLDPADFHSD